MDGNPKSQEKELTPAPTHLKPVSLRHYRGAGDAVAAALAPLINQLDKHLGTDLKHCQGCQGRINFLNHIIPFH